MNIHRVDKRKENAYQSIQTNHNAAAIHMNQKMDLHALISRFHACDRKYALPPP